MQQDPSARFCSFIKLVDLAHIKSPENVVKMLGQNSKCKNQLQKKKICSL